MPSLITKIKRLEAKIVDLQIYLAHLKSKNTAISYQQRPELTEKWTPEGATTVIFDGGTSCNNPKKGFGSGYGSYQILGGPVVRRIQFGVGHSCNSAEIRTLHAALVDLASKVNPGVLHIHIKGDSKIALKWANPKLKMEPSATSWREFHEAIRLLRLELPKFGKITTQWHPRAESVKLFGH